jgi:hypothetical protein
VLKSVEDILVKGTDALQMLVHFAREGAHRQFLLVPET